MSGEGCFLDTNVLIYAVAADDPRAEVAESLIATVLEALTAFRGILQPSVPIALEMHDDALRIAGRYGYHV